MFKLPEALRLFWLLYIISFNLSSSLLNVKGNRVRGSKCLFFPLNLHELLLERKKFGKYSYVQHHFFFVFINNRYSYIA